MPLDWSQFQALLLPRSNIFQSTFINASYLGAEILGVINYPPKISQKITLFEKKLPRPSLCIQKLGSTLPNFYGWRIFPATPVFPQAGSKRRSVATILVGETVPGRAIENLIKSP